jgi:hypothetical protein
MEIMGIGGLYAVMAMAILGGVVLLCHMVVELVRFDPRANRPRSAQVAGPLRRPKPQPFPGAAASRPIATPANHATAPARARVRKAG